MLERFGFGAFLSLWADLDLPSSLHPLWGPPLPSVHQVPATCWIISGRWETSKLPNSLFGPHARASSGSMLGFLLSLLCMGISRTFPETLWGERPEVGLNGDGI